MDDVLERLAGLTFEPEELRFRDRDELEDHLFALERVEVRRIGFSRDNTAMFGCRFGEGPVPVSIIAGCHADEPIGPMTAQLLSRVLYRHFPELPRRFQFRVVPQMNPDGAERNRPWFGMPPGLGAYLRSVVREPPGDDIEFGFGGGPGQRPECANAQQFLKPAMPPAAHFSLHGMAWSHGAWCLLCKEWAGRAAPFMDAFTGLCRRMDVPQHDGDRHGEKGFTRIREGFCTTPTGNAMRQHFLGLNDHATANKFRPSSMDWVLGQGGDPVCMVTEMPLFRIGAPSPALDEPVTAQLNAGIEQLQAENKTGDPEALRALAERYALEPMPIETQVRLQIAVVVLCLVTLLPRNG